MLKRVVGTVPVDESGSVAFEAPAGVPLQFQALDQNGMAVMTMRTFTHLQPGEQAGCVGCHEPRTSSPAIRRSPPAGQVVLKLEPPAGPQYPGGLSFAKTVQPVLDRYCIDCHGLKETAGEINLLGTIDATEENVANAFQQLLPSTAYASLTRDGRLVKIAQYGGETWYSQPKDYFAHGGTLAQLLLEGHEGVDTRPREPPADHRLARSERPVLRHVLLEQGRVAAAGPGRREGAARAHSPEVRRRAGRATVCGAGQRGVAGREPYPESAAGAGGRRLGTD